MTHPVGSKAWLRAYAEEVSRENPRESRETLREESRDLGALEAHELLAARLRLGWTQDTVARALRVTRHRVGQWERGERVIPTTLGLRVRTVLARGFAA